MVFVPRRQAEAQPPAPPPTAPAQPAALAPWTGPIAAELQRSIPPDAAGRPQRYSAEMALLICDRIAGGEGLATICRDRDLPSRRAVRDWLDKDENFAAMFARAREHQADHYAEEIITIADDALDRSHEGIQAARLQVDARKWVASKLRPRVYGDRSSVEHTGSFAIEHLVSGSFVRSAETPRIEAQDAEFTEETP